MNTFCPIAWFATWYFFVIFILMLWDIIWKLLALWRAAQNKHLGWFLCIALLNTVGILPIIYLLTHKKANYILEK